MRWHAKEACEFYVRERAARGMLLDANLSSMLVEAAAQVGQGATAQRLSASLANGTYYL